MSALDFGLVVWDLADGRILLADERASEELLVPLRDLVGRSIYDFVTARDSAELSVAALAAGAADSLRGKQWIAAAGAKPVLTWLWTRTVEVDHHRAAVTLVVPNAEVGRLGRGISAAWELVPIAVGVLDRQWRVLGVSADVEQILGAGPHSWVGTSLLEVVQAEDVPRLVGPDGAVPEMTASLDGVHLKALGGRLVEVCVLLDPRLNASGDQAAFALVGPLEAMSTPDRVAELEMRLRHIGAEVRAAGVIDHLVMGLPAPSDYPQLRELTARQWEILSRLLEGERVPTIAAELYVSQSTVRNHLTTIFRKFGVHSQVDLLRLLRQQRT